MVLALAQYALQDVSALFIAAANIIILFILQCACSPTTILLVKETLSVLTGHIVLLVCYEVDNFLFNIFF